MFIKPETGGIWDPTILYYKGYYYLVTMYFKDGEERRDDYMWAARSKDGVHWEDLGAVLEHKNGVCKMFIYEIPEGIVADFGSFDKLPKVNNDTIRFCISKDMINWEYIGENHPDPRWYVTTGRWDHMYVYKDLSRQPPVYYGYPVATPLPQMLSAWGLCRSLDGLEWEVLPPPVINWGEYPPINCLEVGGMEKIGDKYYFIGGFVGYAGNYGYGLYTFSADSPTGPFTPCKGAFRLCGFDRLPGRVFVQCLASFARGKDGEILISNAVDAGGPHEIWVLPLRKAVVDEAGLLHMGYWQGNEDVKGEEITVFGKDFQVKYCSYPKGSPLPAETYLPSDFNATENGFDANTDSYNSPNVWDHDMLILYQKEIDLEEGIVLEGTVWATSYPAYDQVRHATIMWRPASFGIYFDEEIGGMDIALEIGHPYKRYSHVENIKWDEDNFSREIVDTIGEDCADVRGMSPGEEHSFKVFYRRNMFELYLDDLHVQTFVHLGEKTGRIGFTLSNASVKVRNLKMYKMNL